MKKNIPKKMIKKEEHKKKFLCFCLQCKWIWLAKTEKPIKCPYKKCTNPYYWWRERTEAEEKKKEK